MMDNIKHHNHILNFYYLHILYILSYQNIKVLFFYRNLIQFQIFLFLLIQILVKVNVVLIFFHLNHIFESSMKMEFLDISFSSLLESFCIIYEFGTPTTTRTTTAR